MIRMRRWTCPEGNQQATTVLVSGGFSEALVGLGDTAFAYQA